MKRSPQLDQYKRFVGEDVLARIYCAAESLAGVSVLHINTTAEGGGVAELLQSLLPLMEELGIPHSWKVIPLDEASNLFAAHLADLLQGMVHDDIPEADQHVFLEKLRRIPDMQRADQNHADIYFIHDFQLAPLATLLQKLAIRKGPYYHANDRPFQRKKSIPDPREGIEDAGSMRCRHNAASHHAGFAVRQLEKSLAGDRRLSPGETGTSFGAGSPCRCYGSRR